MTVSPASPPPDYRVEARGSLPTLYVASLWAFALLLLAIFCLQAGEDWRAIDTRQITEARRSARYVSQTVARELEEQRRMLAVFTHVHHPLIQAVLDQPQDEAPQRALRQAITAFYPKAFAFTLADRRGNPVIDDFDGLVGDVCRANITHFANHGQDQPIYLHPHPEVYHYDLMRPFGEHIFFISLQPDPLVRWLRENAALGQQLFLIKDDSHLIELGAGGTRLNLGREMHLSEAEAAALLLRLPVAGTHWWLVVLPDLALIGQQKRGILYSLAARGGGVLLLTGLMLWLLRREAARRLEAEHQARDLALLSNTDALTGLPNRRALDDTLSREWHWMARTGQPLSLMMVDIDHFKPYNDHLGHVSGDQALRAVAQALSRVASRPRDMVGRYGGEEFMVVLPDTPADAAVHLAGAMHGAVRKLALPHPSSPLGPQVTLSIGVVSARKGAAHSVAQLVEQADEALYAAKEAGRDTTRVHATPTDPA